MRWQERQESRKKTKINVFVKDLCSTTLSQEIVKLPFKTFLLKLKRSVYTNFASKFWFVCLVSWHFFCFDSIFCNCYNFLPLWIWLLRLPCCHIFIFSYSKEYPHLVLNIYIYIIYIYTYIYIYIYICQPEGHS